MTSEKTLFVGEMFNGTLEADVPSDVANLPDWKAPIFIGVVAGKHGNISAIGLYKNSKQSCFANIRQIYFLKDKIVHKALQ